MSRTPLPYSAGDISALARSLRAQLADKPEPPGHVAWLNMLAKAAGFRNYQHFEAQSTFAVAEPAPLPAPEPVVLPEPPPAAPVVDLARIRKVARCFDDAGLFQRWPSKLGEQRLCLWVIWSRIDAGKVMNEKQVNQVLNAHHTFGDHALLRRDLCELGLMTRTPDGREYRRVERQPPPEALALIRHLGSRQAAAPAGAARQIASQSAR